MKDFKIGDRVRFKGDGRIGEIFDIEGYNELIMDIVYWVRFPDGQEGTSPMQDLEFADPKTAFLTEMQSLLRMYDAKIYVWSGEDGDMSLTFGLKDNIDIRYPNEWCTDYKFEFPITPDNIFDYEKE